MNQDQVEGQFDQLKGEFKKTWGKLTDNDLMLYKGNRDKFFGKLQEYYGIAREEAENRVKAIEKSCSSCSSDRAA